MSGSLSVEEFWGQTAKYFRKQQRKEGWKVRQSIIQAASLMGPVGYDNRPLSILPWVSAVCVKMCIVKVTRNLRYTVNKTFWVWRYTYMWADLMRAEVVFMGQSDLFRVQWALSLAGGEHSPSQSPPLSPGHAQPSPGARPSTGTQTHRWAWLMCWTSPTRTPLSPLSKPLHPPSNLAYFCPSLVCVCVWRGTFLHLTWGFDDWNHQWWIPIAQFCPVCSMFNHSFGFLSDKRSWKNANAADYVYLKQ